MNFNFYRAQRIAKIGKEVGIDFTYKAQRSPNTVMGHCALEYALIQDPTGKKQNAVSSTLTYV